MAIGLCILLLNSLGSVLAYRALMADQAKAARGCLSSLGFDEERRAYRGDSCMQIERVSAYLGLTRGGVQSISSATRAYLPCAEAILASRSHLTFALRPIDRCQRLREIED